MSTEINDIADLVRILEEKPEWVSRLRPIILGKDLLDLTQEFRGHREETRRQYAQIQEQFSLVNARLDSLEAEVAEIRRSQGEMEARMTRIEAQMIRMEERQERQEKTEAWQGQMEARQDRMEKHLANLDGTVSGAEYEVKVIRNLRPIARDSNLHRIRSLFSRNKDFDQQLDENLDQAVADNRIYGGAGSRHPEFGRSSPSPEQGNWRTDLCRHRSLPDRAD